MSSRSATLVAQLVDKVSGPAAKAAAGMDKLAKAVDGKALGGNVDKLAASLDQAAKSAKGLNVDKAARDLKALNKVAAETATVVPFKNFSADMKRFIGDQRLGRREMAGLAKAYASMQAEQAKTLGAIANPKIRAQLIDKDMASIEGRIRDRARRIRAQRDVVDDLLGGDRNGHRARRRLGDLARTGATVAGVTGGAYIGQRAVRGAIGEGAGHVREDIREKNAGMSPAESQALRAKAAELSLQYPSLSKLGIREQGRLLIPNVGDAAKALELLPEYMRGQVAVQTIAGPKDAGHEMEKFARYVDIIGRSTNLADTKRLIDGYVRARQLDSGAVSADDFVNAAQTAAGPGKGLSTGFWAEVMPALIMQQKGNRSGTDLTSAYQNTVLGRASDAALIAQESAGIRTGLEKRRVGGKWKVTNRGQFVDDELYGSNPLDWLKKHVVPRMADKGLLPAGYAKGDYSEQLTDTQKTQSTKYLSDLMSMRRGANIWSMLVQDLQQVDQIITRLRNAKGAADVAEDQRRDPYVAMEGITQQLKNVGAAFLEPGIQSLGPTLTNIAVGLGKLAQAAEKHPDAVLDATTRGAVPAAGGLSWLTGKGLAKVAGEGMLPSMLRGLAPWLDATGKALGRLAVPLNAVMAAKDLHDRTKPLEGMNSEERIRKFQGGRSKGQVLRDRFNEERRRFGVPELGQVDRLGAERDELQRTITSERGRHFPGGAVGDAMIARSAVRLKQLEERLEGLNEQIREGNRGQGLSRFPAPQFAPAFPQRRPVELGGTAAPKVDASDVEQFDEKAKTARQNFSALDTSVTPRVNSDGVDRAIEKARTLLALLDQVGAKADDRTIPRAVNNARSYTDT